MKIIKLDIRKFRSIDKCVLDISNINAIVGQNNSGKSTVIRALNAFFNPDDEIACFYQAKHAYDNKSVSRITLTFDDFGVGFEDCVHNNILEVELSYKQSNKKLSYRVKRGVSTSIAPEGLLNRIKEKIAFVYIPLNRNSQQFKWEEDALIKTLVEKKLELETQRRDTLSPKFKAATDYLEKGALKRISSKVESYYSLRRGFDFSFSFEKDTSFKNFLSSIEVYIEEAGVKHILEDCGTGLQSLTVIALHRLLASLKDQDIILGLEEPETNLHPQAQRELIHSIRKSSNDGEVVQVFFTTYSTVLVDNISHLDIILVSKCKDVTRGFKSQVLKLASNFFDIHDINEFKYYQYHDYNNSDFFYASFVVFVESKNDAEVVRYLAAKNNIDLDLYGVSVVPMGGVNNFKYGYQVVHGLNMPYLVIVDKDYFIPYLNDDLESSRSQNGLPRYRHVFKENILMDQLITEEEDRSLLLTHFQSNHTKALDVLERHNIVCMNYNLESDLLCSSKAVELMASCLRLSPAESNMKCLLENYSKAIKKIGNILEVVGDLPPRNLPTSYKRIVRQLKKIVANC